MAIVERVALRLAARLDIQNHEIQGLRGALIGEKKRRERKKHLNLVGEEVNSAPQFFSPQKVLQARAFQETKEAVEQEEKRQKALQKEEATRRRQQ